MPSHYIHMLALLATACPSFSLGQAKTRFGSDARSQFAAALPSSDRAFELAVLLAAEERPEDCVASISEEIDAGISTLVEKCQARISLAAIVGGDPKNPKSIATAVSRVLFGSGAPDDAGEEAFFRGSSQTDYYDPRNSYLDCVLERRQGIPITLSLVYAEVCGRLGLEMVGLNTPRHLLIAPADRETPFVVVRCAPKAQTKCNRL